MKKSLVMTLLVLSSALFTTACSFETVEPATKGKILSPSGYSPEVLPPGKYTTWFRQQLVTLDTSTNTYEEPVTVKMSDKLTLTADVRFRARIGGAASTINSMFNDIQAGDDNRIEFGEVYRIYGQPAVRNVTREVLSQYTVDDVHLNYARLSGEIGAALASRLEGTPIEISEVALGEIDYPDVVNKAINLAEERRLQIEAEQAQAEIDQVKKENERILAEAEYQVEMTRAQTIRDRNTTIAEGLTPAVLELRRIEALERMAENENAVFMPYEALVTPGASVQMFNRQ